MLRRVPVGLLSFVSWMAALSLPAHAQESDTAALPNAGTRGGPQMANVIYLAGPNCPPESAFWTEVGVHRRNPEALEAPRIRVEVYEVGSGAEARVTFVNDSGVTATRELAGSSCREAAAAAALVVALALDAHREERKAPNLPAARPAEPPPRAQPPSPASPDVAHAPGRKERSFFWQLGGGAFAQQAIAPSPLIGAIAFAGLGEYDSSWDARVGVAFAGSGVTQRNDASAEFSLLAAQLEGCAFRIVRAERFSVDPCVAAELGQVTSRGIENLRYSGEEQSTFWAAGGPGLRMSYAFSKLRLEAHGGPWIRIAGTRDYVFADSQGNRSFHEVPPVGLTGGVRAAVHLD
jgi:hypothetical protein